MGQQIWNMDSVTGDHYTIGLYHGEESGNVVLYMNNEVFLIDFNILEDKNYHFFVGHEFMCLSILRKNEEYFYNLQVDKDTPTPLNTAIRKSEAADEKLLLTGMIAASILLLALFIYNCYVRYIF